MTANPNISCEVLCYAIEICCIRGRTFVCVYDPRREDNENVTSFVFVHEPGRHDLGCGTV